MKSIFVLMAVLFAGPALADSPAPLTAVGVLGNSSGLSDRPVPYAFYTGIAADARGRLYLAGADEGIVVCEPNGSCLAVLPLPGGQSMSCRSLLCRSGNAIFFVAGNGQSKSALYRIQTAAQDPAAPRIDRLTDGAGIWAISQTLDPQKRILIGQADLSKLQYSVAAVDSASGQVTPLFTIAMPTGVLRPWMQVIQAENDGTISIEYAGGKNWSGRYDAKGNQVGPAIKGQIVGGYRYTFGYDGGLRRMDLGGAIASPGDCGSPAPEIRKANQMVPVGDRYYFAGRGGALEARWSGTDFQYVRRIGGLWLEDLTCTGGPLRGIAYTHAGFDVQYAISIPRAQPIGQVLEVGPPLHEGGAMAVAEAPEGLILLYRMAKGLAITYRRTTGQTEFDLPLPQLLSIGQAAVLGKDILIADPNSGTLWRRPMLDKHAPLTAWKDQLPGVIGLAAGGGSVYAATTTKVFALSGDGRQTWICPEKYRGIRRLACGGGHVFVCDEAGHVVDQLDAATGKVQARLGRMGEGGQTLSMLNHPHAVTADENAVYIADNGNGRVVVATATLWRPQISILPREDSSPITAAQIPVQPPRAGRMSVSICDANDVTIRQVAAAVDSSQPVTWDGRNMYGAWAAPGKYRYNGIIAPKFSLRYVTSVSQSGTPPYNTPDGKGSWGGVWGYVMDICPVTSEPASDIVVLWAFEEGEGGLIRMSQDGAVRWKQHLDWWMKANQMAVASDGNAVYVLCASAMGAPTGQSKYNGEFHRPMIWRVDAATGVKRLYAPSGQNQPMFGQYRPGPRIATALAVRDGKLYFTAPSEGRLFVADASTAVKLEEWDIPNVSGVAFDSAGHLFAGSGNTIVELGASGKVKRQVADAGGEIWGLATLPADGLAATVGGPRQQVVCFDAAGKETRALGARGGRPKCGKMQPESFRDPVGLCATSGGEIFVAEAAAPKRFTRWSAQGKLVREFHGPYYYSGMFGIDEEHPEFVYGDTHGDIIRYKVDYQTGVWEVDRYWIGAYEDSGVPAKWWPRIRHHDGEVWWCSGSGGIVELRDDSVRGVAAVYGGWVQRLPDGNYAHVTNGKKTGLKGTWSDLNGDGKQQASEWQVTDAPAYPADAAGPQQGWGSYFDANFDLYMHDWSDDDAGGVWQIPVSEWTNGVPVYRWDRARHVGLPRYNGLAHGGSGARTCFADGGAVYAFNGAYNAANLPGVGHGHDWEFAQITKYDPATGQALWHAGERTPAFAGPGQHYCPTGAAGVIDDYLFWTDENSLIHVWDTKHGLYVDTLLEDISRGPAPSPYTVWVELFNSRVFRHPATGKVYLLAASDAIHIYQVLGTEQKPVRFSGEFELTEASLTAARQRWQRRSAESQRTLAIPRARSPIPIDGDVAPFAEAPAAAMTLKPTAQGTVRCLYDDQFLYVAFDVQDDSPWKNSGGDATAMFKTGDEVSVWLGPSAGNRPAGLGDVRILFAPSGAKTAVVAYRPKVAQGAKPVQFRSPAGLVTMDRVDALDDVKVAVKVLQGSYRLTAAIPWSELGGKSASGQFGLDFSINFSDPAGQRNVARLHWGRNGAAVVYDLPTEARLEPQTWGVGILEH